MSRENEQWRSASEQLRSNRNWRRDSGISRAILHRDGSERDHRIRPSDHPSVRVREDVSVIDHRATVRSRSRAGRAGESGGIASKFRVGIFGAMSAGIRGFGGRSAGVLSTERGSQFARRVKAGGKGPDVESQIGRREEPSVSGKASTSGPMVNVRHEKYGVGADLGHSCRKKSWGHARGLMAWCWPAGSHPAIADWMPSEIMQARKPPINSIGRHNCC